ncbi:MAG: CBS domain-containing protein [candidate division NC10 bacterium]|nr:CBS domain-containing protein [candidate division NC10 bacterium]
MELIATHINADFDSLASMMAASKLYPGAKLVFPGSQERNVREFLQQTHFPLLFEKLKKLELSSVTRLILVDAKRASRIGPLRDLLGRPDLEIHIYDHHPAHPKDISGRVEVLREVGATTTILIQCLQEREVSLNAQEATLLALGIYEETGFLTFTSTTEEDLRAAAFCLSRGADLALVSDYIRRELTAEQVSLLSELINSAESFSIHGVEIVISTASLEKYVGDLALLTHKLRDLENINVLFTLVSMDNRIHLVARSRIEEVDVGQIASSFGGGGHPTAASATIKEMTLIEAKERLLRALKEKVRPMVYAKDIMSSPLKAISDQITVGKAAEIMNRFSIGTIPVVRSGELVGLINRETVDRALYHGLREAPVSGFMSAHPPTVNPDTPLPRIQRLIVESNLGLLPVVDHRRLRGVVTRTDLLRLAYEDLMRRPTFLREVEKEIGPYFTRSVTNLMNTRLPASLLSLLQRCGEVADQAGASVFVVGGFVRDLLLGVENADIDLVLEGDGIAYAERVAAQLGGRVRAHPKFGTAVLTWPDGFRIDVASARAEYYEHPAALPTVEHSSIKMDLYRRDFTINTLAIRLNAKGFGEIIDFFGGQRDLRNKTIRILHNLSFVEDPTRILRAVRFESRFGFKVSKDTEQLIKNAVKMNLLDRVSGRRVFGELALIFTEPQPSTILLRLEELQAFDFLHPGFHFDQEMANRFNRVQEALVWYRLLYRREEVSTVQLYMIALLARLRPHEAKGVMRRLELPPKLGSKMETDLARVRQLERELAIRKDLSPSRLYRLMGEASPEALLLLLALSKEEKAKRAVSDFLTTYSRVRAHLKGKDLRALGVPPGPIYKKILNTLLYARLEGKVETKEDEIRLVQSKFGSHLPSRPPSARTG